MILPKRNFLVNVYRDNKYSDSDDLLLLNYDVSSRTYCSTTMSRVVLAAQPRCLESHLLLIHVSESYLLLNHDVSSRTYCSTTMSRVALTAQPRYVRSLILCRLYKGPSDETINRKKDHALTLLILRSLLEFMERPK